MLKLDVTFKADTIIFEEGAVEDSMYFIRTGKVEISRAFGDTNHVLAVLGPGDFFGEMALVHQEPRTATAKAIQETVAISFNRKQFLILMRNKGDIALKIIVGLISRIKDSNDIIRKLIQKNQNALVFDALSKWLQLEKEGPAEIQVASEWVGAQLGMKTRETEMVIRKLVMMDLIILNDNKVSINETGEAEKLKKILEE